MSMYELAMGEFMLDAYHALDNQIILIYILFILSTFLIQVTFLNMLIAIMGDVFDRAIDDRENNARKTKLNIMGDYINLIQKEPSESRWEEHTPNIP